MPTPPSDKARIAAEETAYDSLGRTIRRLQGQAHELLINWFGDNISSQDGKVKMNAGNLAKVGGVFNVLQGFGKTLKRIVLGEVMDSAGTIIDANQSYFETFADPVDIQVEARYQALLRMGYNTKNGLILPGGYLDSLFKNGDVSQRVAQLMNQAIAGGMSLKDFRLLFKNVFVGQAGAGMLERYYKTATFDLFQRIDRAAHLVYADRLGLDNAIYSGTLIDTSRIECIRAVGKVFSRKEIEAWKNEKWPSKPLIYDPYLDCRGINCRHHWSFVSAQIAAYLRDKQNKATPPPETLQSIEDRIRKQEFESAAVYDENGKQVYFKNGANKEVEFDEREQALMKGNIMTHNHPVDLSFSKADVEFFNSTGLKEIRAVGKDYTYSLTNPKGVKLSEDELSKAYDKSQKSIVKTLTGLMEKGKITEDFANNNYHHSTMVNLAKNTGFVYTRTKRP